MNPNDPQFDDDPGIVPYLLAITIVVIAIVLWCQYPDNAGEYPPDITKRPQAKKIESL